MKPEDVRHFELGVKTEPFAGVTANFTLFQTEVQDYQTQVVNAQVGVNRGYLANAEKVRVRGVEFDGNVRVSDNCLLLRAIAWTDGEYVSFPDAPVPLEETGGPQARTYRAPSFPASPNGRLPSVASTPSQRACSAGWRSSSGGWTTVIAPRSPRARPPLGIWWFPPISWSTLESASGPQMAGLFPYGAAT